MGDFVLRVGTKRREGNVDLLHHGIHIRDKIITSDKIGKIYSHLAL